MRGVVYQRASIHPGDGGVSGEVSVKIDIALMAMMGLSILVGMVLLAGLAM